MLCHTIKDGKENGEKQNVTVSIICYLCAKFYNGRAVSTQTLPQCESPGGKY